MKSKNLAHVVFVIMMTFTVAAQADTIWDEGVNGPLSSMVGMPTVVTLVSPSDQVLGNGTLGDKYLSFTVPVGNTVSSMVLDPGIGGILAADISSTSINCGPYSVIVSTELLDGAICVTSLPPGDYSVHVEVIGSQPWSLTIASDVPVELQSLTVD